MDIEESFNAEGAEIYIAEIDGERVGGAVIVVNEKTGYNSLHLLYVKSGSQNAGNGFAIWKSIENLHPETKIWETHTPYYDKRNIHFYIIAVVSRLWNSLIHGTKILIKQMILPEIFHQKTTAFLDLRRKCSKYFPFYLVQHPYRGHP